MIRALSDAQAALLAQAASPTDARSSDVQAEKTPSPDGLRPKDTVTISPEAQALLEAARCGST